MSSISKGYLKAEVINLLEQAEMDEQVLDIKGATDLIIEPLINLFRMYFEPTFKEAKEEVTVTTYATQEQVETRIKELMEQVANLERGAKEQEQTIEQWRSYAETKDNNEKILLDANNKLKDSYDAETIALKGNIGSLKDEINWLRGLIEKAVTK
jgi:exonuclease VII small subunit